MKKSLHRPLSIIEGCLLVALGIWFLNVNELLVSGTAGMSALLDYQFSLSFGTFFFLINLPFFALALKELGKSMAFNSLCAIVLVSTFSDGFIHFFEVDTIPPWIAAMCAGLLIGVGLSIVFAANASLGGINILALAIEKRWGIHSAKILLVTDMCLAAVAMLILPWQSVLYSMLAFSILSLVMGRYHKKGGQKIQLANEPQVEPASAAQPA